MLKTSFKPPAALQAPGPLQGGRRGGAGGGGGGFDEAAEAALRRRQAYALMALHGLLGAPDEARAGDVHAWRQRDRAAWALVPNDLIARRMLADVLAAPYGANTVGARAASLVVLSFSGGAPG